MSDINLLLDHFGPGPIGSLNNTRERPDHPDHRIQSDRFDNGGGPMGPLFIVTLFYYWSLIIYTPHGPRVAGALPAGSFIVIEWGRILIPTGHTNL